MEHKEALANLKSVNAHTRLLAARYLFHLSNADDLHAIRKARSKESVSWIIKALDSIIAKLEKKNDKTGSARSQPAIADSVPDVTPERLASEVRSIAVEETTRQLIHELEPLLGALRRAGTREIEDYLVSKTYRLHDRFDNLLQAISTLSKSTSSAKPHEFDLAELLHDLIIDESSTVDMNIDEVGNKPLIVVGDSSLISIAIRNGLRNAIEASLSADPSKTETVIVTWGETDQDYWVTILDRGSGLPPSLKRVWDIGSTTKIDHLGMGLPLAKSAIESMGGTIDLSPRQDSGARFEIRWPLASGTTQ